MSVWEKVFKNPRSRNVLPYASALSVPDIKLPKRSYQLPSLFIGLCIGTTYTRRTFLCQVGTEIMRWNAENMQGKIDLSVFRIEKILSDNHQEISLGDEALSNFMSDRGDPSCTLFLQPVRFLLPTIKLPSFVSTYEGQKVLYQSPSSQELYKSYVKSQLEYIWKKAHSLYSEIRRFQVGQIVVEYPDYFATADLKKYKSWMVEAAQEFFPPVLSPEEESVELADRFTMIPESVITLLHWLTDMVEPKLAAQELDIKKMMVRHGLLPRTTEPINFLVVTMGATHSRVVRLRVPSMSHLASNKRVGESVNIGHSYLGRTGFGGDHISCAFLDEEEERRYGGNPAHRVNTWTRKVVEDWNKMNTAEGKKHFEELYGEEFGKAMEKLGELTLKGFGENPENTIVILGGKTFTIPYFRDAFKEYLHNHRIPVCRIVSPSTEDTGIERLCEIIQFQQKGLGRSFVVRTGVESEGVQRFSWKIGKVVDGSLVDAILSPDNKEWDAGHHREFTLSFERGVRSINLGAQKSTGGISQLWANISLKEKRVTVPLQVTFRTESPDDLKIVNILAEGKSTTAVKADDFQINMLIAGEHPSHFPLHDKILKANT